MRKPAASFAHRLIAALAFQLFAAIAALAASADPASPVRLREADLQQIDTIVRSGIELKPSLRGQTCGLSPRGSSAVLDAPREFAHHPKDLTASSSCGM